MFSAARRGVILVSIGLMFSPGCSRISDTGVAPHPKPAESPQVAAQAVLNDLKAAKPVAVWNILADNQQVAVDSAIRDFADAMDPEVWDHTVRTLKKLVGVLETKRDFILENPLWRTNKNWKLADIKASWAPAVRIAKTISESELVDLQKMKKFDGRAFLEGTGAKLYAETHELFQSLKNDPLKRFEDAQLSFKDVSAQTATVLLQPADPKAKPISLIIDYTDGKWIVPQLSFVAVGMLKRIATYRELFNTYCVADWKDQYIADITGLEHALDKLAAAKTSDDFQAIVLGEVLPIALVRGAQFRRGVPTYTGVKAESYRRRATAALIVIAGAHAGDEPALRALTAQLKQATPPPESVSLPKTAEGKTVMIVDPVEDINALAKAIVVGKVIRVDAKRKMLTVELPKAETDHKASTSQPKPGT